jgi:KDO2-lipid IV(A) lauroyltransferase
MGLQSFLGDRRVTAAGIGLARRLPRRLTLGLVALAVAAIDRRRPALHGVVRANLAQILGPAAGEAELDARTRAVFAHAGQCYVDFFRAVDYDAARLGRAVARPPGLLEEVAATSAAGQGVLILGAHTSNFDLAIISLAAAGLPIQALSLAAPHDGFRLLNRLRARYKLEFTPIDAHALRAAIRRLRGGGIVMTALDWPVVEDGGAVELFGRPSYFALGPARLALMTGARVYLAGCRYRPGEGYAAEVEPFALAAGEGPREVVAVAGRLAAALERFVARCPEQWLMFHPFWPAEPVEQDSSLLAVRQASPLRTPAP